jgi:hypothetical protein
LDQIHDGVVRIKHIAVAMNDELDEQQRLLDDADDSMDRVNNRLKSNTTLVKDVGEKASCGMSFWIMILLLVVIFM